MVLHLKDHSGHIIFLFTVNNSRSTTILCSSDGGVGVVRLPVVTTSGCIKRWPPDPCLAGHLQAAFGVWFSIISLKYQDTPYSASPVHTFGFVHFLPPCTAGRTPRAISRERADIFIALGRGPLGLSVWDVLVSSLLLSRQIIRGGIKIKKWENWSLISYISSTARRMQNTNEWLKTGLVGADKQSL